MSSFPNKFLSALKKNVWALTAFFIPLAIRSIPEVLSWPYPLGLDTQRYIPIFESGQVLSSFYSFFTSHLFYSLATLSYDIIPNGILIVKIFGPLLLAALSLMMYFYAKRGLGWSGFKSFLVALFVATYFVSLRNSWDLYNQTLGLIFLLAALVILKSYNSPRKYALAFIFMLLTVLSHELPSAILFFVLGFEAIHLLVNKKIKDFAYLITSVSLVGFLFFSTHFWSGSGSSILPVMSVASEPSTSLALYMAGLMVYCYVLILPLVIVGIFYLKDRILRYWALLCVGIPLILMVFPTAPLYYWNRWVYLLVYPLLFFAVHGLDKLWGFLNNNKNKLKRLLPKAFAVTYLVLLLSVSAFYLGSSPNNQISFFSADNPYLAFIPSSMLQNTLPISDNPSLMHCFQWINNNTPQNSAVVMHYALYDSAVIYVNNRALIAVLPPSSMWQHLQNQTTLADGMAETAKLELNNGHSAVYTVWWIIGKGWYDIPSLPSSFQEVYRSGNMAVYLYNANT